MPQYFFHLYDTGECLDEEGSHHADPDAARTYAMDNVRSIMADDVRAGILNFDGRIEVRDAAGEPALTVRFEDAVKLFR